MLYTNGYKILSKKKRVRYGPTGQGALILVCRHEPEANTNPCHEIVSEFVSEMHPMFWIRL